MRKKLSRSVFLVLWIIIFAFKGLVSQAELIEPSRSLKTDSGDPGRLTVFSEPPGQGVTLDGESIGSTPIRINSLNPGVHQLQVGKFVTEVYIEPGKTFHISLFRNRFIKFDNAYKDATASDSSDLKSGDSRASEKTPQQSLTEKANRKAWNRWMQFVDGTSNHF